jgi:hypothetical protein
MGRGRELVLSGAAMTPFMQRSLRNLCLVLMAIAILGFSIVGHYGISYDEEGPLRVAFENFKIVREGKPYQGHLRHYGTLFNMASEVAFQGKIRFSGSAFPAQDRFDSGSYVIAPFYERLKVKRVLRFLLALTTYAAVAGLVAVLVGWQYAWLGALLLALFPRFWGHSFINSKDIPLAAMITLGTLLGVCFIGYLQKHEKISLRIGFNPVTLSALGYGVWVGLVAGVRLDGSIVLLFTLIAHCVSGLGAESILGWFSRFWGVYGVAALAWMGMTLLINPSAWFNPWQWFWETLQFYYDEDWDLTVLFDGKFIKAEDPPWNYLPKWLSIVTPEIFLLVFGLGLVGLIWRYQTFSRLQKACIVGVLLQIFALPLLVIGLRSTIYDEARMFLYMIPGIATLATITLVWIYQWVYQALAHKYLKLFAIALTIALLSPIALDMIALHPYEYLYFNRSFGGLVKAQGRFETDYWALSMREGMEWINRTVAPNSTIVSSAPIYAAAPFARADLKVIPREAISPGKTPNSFYYIAIPRWDFQQQFPHCEVLYQVQRQGAALTQVKHCH